MPSQTAPVSERRQHPPAPRRDQPDTNNARPPLSLDEFWKRIGS
jgi:hypothetical protein